MTDVLLYTSNRAVRELEVEVDRAWGAIRRSGELERRGVARGLPAILVHRLRRRDLVRLEPGAGLDPVVSGVLVAFASAAGGEVARLIASFARDVWGDVVLPRLRRRLGADALADADEPQRRAG